MAKKEILRLTSGVLEYAGKYFRENGFVQLMPVILSTATDPLGPDPGSTVIKTGEIEYLGQRLMLTQSMILHKQIAVKEGIDKLFIVSPNVRLEHPKRRDSGKHLFEFSQLDFEIAHAKMEDVFSLMEGFYAGLKPYLDERHAEELRMLGRELPDMCGPYERFRLGDLVKKYGDGWESIKSHEMKKPFWVISHRREFYDKDDPERPGEWLNYDLIYPEGFCEALSGAEREHEYERIISKIGRHGLGTERYEGYLKIAKDGLTPSAGGGFGIERLVRFVAGVPHIGEVQLFKRVPGEPVVV